MSKLNRKEIIVDCIRKAGGVSVVAGHFAVSPWAVGKWIKEAKVPAARVPALIMLSNYSAYPHELNNDLPVSEIGKCPYCHHSHPRAA